jgi:hypothetical protein
MKTKIFSIISIAIILVLLIPSCKKNNTIVINSEVIPSQGALLNYYKSFDPEILNSGDTFKIKVYLDKKAAVIYEYLKTNYHDTICSISDGKSANIILGGLVIAIHEQNQYGNTSLLMTKSNSLLRTNSAPYSQAIHCALAAVTGYEGIEKLLTGTASLMSGTEVLALLKGVLKRYVGYIGIAIAVYEFGGCMGWYN